MPTQKANNVDLYYETYGDGPPLIMIQGLSANINWWDPRLIEGLSEDFRVIAFDNRGAGRSGSSDEEYTIKLLAEDVSSLMDTLEISQAHILGISMGGMIAQETVLNYPDKVNKLILCSTSCGGSKAVQASEEVLETLNMDRSSMTQEEVIEETIPPLFTEDFIENYPDFIDIARQQLVKNPISQEDFNRQIKAILEFDSYDRLDEIESQTLILHGKEDILIPPENGEILDDAIPNSKLVYFENSAHGLMEEMNEVISTIKEFLHD